MGQFLLALAVFLISHGVPSQPAVRARLTAIFGERGYLIGYSLVSLALLAWLIHAAVTAPYIPLWPAALWQQWVPVLVMPLATVLLVAGVIQPNPLSIPVRPSAYDPARPGVLALTRHPILAAISLWALAHIPPNGHLVAVTMFGLFALMGIGGMALLDRRRQRSLGTARWAALAAPSSGLPASALIAGRARMRVTVAGVLTILAGLGLYAILIHLHRPVLGVPIAVIG